MGFELLSRRNVNGVDGVLGVYTTNVVRPLRDTSSLTRRVVDAVELNTSGALSGFKSGHDGLRGEILCNVLVRVQYIVLHE